jgi:hypothetical protein
MPPANSRTSQSSLGASQNLARNVGEEKTPLPKGFFRAIVLDILTVGTAIGVSYFYRGYLRGTSGIISLLVVLGVFLLFSIFEVLLQPSRLRRFGVLVLEVIALLGFFVSIMPVGFLVAAAVSALLLMVWGEYAGRSEADNSMEVRFFRIVRPLLGRYVTALVLLGVLFYLPNFDAHKDLFSEDNFGTVFGWAAGAAANFYPDVTFTGTVQSFADSVARMQLKSNEEFRALPVSRQPAVVDQVSQKLVGDLGATFGVPARGDQTFASLLYAYISNALGKFEQQFGQQFLFVWAVALFLAARSIGVLFSFVIAVIGYVIFQMLLTFNAIHIIGESRMHEVIGYS